MRRVGFIVILGLLVVGASQPTLGQTTQYSVTNLGFVSGNSLNDKGQVAGGKSSFSLATTPFVWDAANGVQDIGIPPGFTSASATGINNLGHVAGEASVGPGTFPGLFYWDSTKGFLLPGFSVQSSSSISDTDLIALIPSNAPAFLWGPVSGAQPLQVPCPGLESGVKDISSSGAFVVGFAAVRLPTCDSSGPFNDVAVMWSAGSSTQLTVFGAWGVNNLGQVVGNVCQPSGFSPCHAAVWTKNVLQDIGLLAGDLNAVAYGINDAGQVVGDSAGSFSYRAFVWDSKNGMRDLNSLIPAGSGIVLTHAFKINNSGQILATGSGPLGSTFLLTPPAPPLIDPVPSLLAALANQNLGGLATGGNVVKGVAADGVSEVVVRIPAANVGDQFTLTLLNDQGQSSTSSSDDGGLGVVGQQNFSSQITTSAVSTPSGTMAFALYRAPTDFPRGSPPTITCGGVTGSDAQLACRFVTIQVQGPSGSPIPLPVTILRPPVVLVHGLWDDQTAWDNFTGLTNDPLSRFFIGRADYSYNVGNSLGAFTPTYESFAYPFLNSARANSLGFSYNALGVLSQIQTFVGEFKSGKNPLGISVASVQADIVAHSMGGDIARDLPLAPSFLSFDTFAQGNIHKLITIGTPHLGSPLANQLLSDSNICVRSVLALKGKVTFDKVSVFGQVTSGGVSDLQGDGFGTFPALSPPLQALQQSTAHPLPTAMISGIADSSNFNALNSSVFASLLTQFCPEPLAQALTPAGWPLIFGQSSDAIVPLRSQLNLTAGTPITATPISSVVHSKGTESLGFGPPDELDDVTGIPTAVIGLLNTPVTSSTFTPLP